MFQDANSLHINLSIQFNLGTNPKMAFSYGLWEMESKANLEKKMDYNSYEKFKYKEKN